MITMPRPLLGLAIPLLLTASFGKVAAAPAASALPYPFVFLRDIDGTILQDVRYATRRMRQAPFFSAAIIVTLALATGATTAIFSVVDTVLLRALPYAKADRLVMLYQGIPKAIARPIGFSAPDYHAFAGRATSFESLAAFRNREYELSGVNEPERIIAARASAALSAVETR